MSSLLRSSKFIRYFAGAARNLVASTRFSPETGQLPSFSTPSAPYLRSLATQATSANQFSSNLERSLQQLDQDVRRTGRISRKELEEVLEEIKQSKNATSSQSLLVIRCCGNLVPEELPEIRTKLVQEIWATLEKLKVPMDISHYNALLRVYLENEHNFSPAEFLQDLERKGVDPNRVTYQRLITRYCQQGDIEGATRILEFMREKSLPVNESVFNALILGHSQAEDMESATGILAVMKQAGLEPSADTFTTLLVGHAKRGDMDQIRQILADCDRNEIYLLDKDHLDIVFALATNGHAAHVDEILARTRKSSGFNQDAVSLILRLVNHGQEQVALKVLRLMPRPQREDSESNGNQGNFFIRQLAKADRPIDSILSICRAMESEGLNRNTLPIVVEASLARGNVDLALNLLKALKETGAPIRQHYFWPLLCAAGRAKDDNQIANVLEAMIQVFGLPPSGETIREYVIPNLTIRNKDLIVGFLKRAGVSSGSSACSLVLDCLQDGLIADAATVASKYRAYYGPALLRRPLNQAFLKTGASEAYVNLVHHIYEGMDRQGPQIEDAEGGRIDRQDVVGMLLIDLVTSSKGNHFNLTSILEGLLKRGLGITNEAAEQIQTKLSGERLTNEISELLTKLTALDLQATAAVRNRIPETAFINDEATLQQRIDKAEEAGRSSAVIKRNLLIMHSRNGEVDKAMEVLESLGSEAGPGAHAILIEGLTTAGKVDQALELIQKLRQANSDFALDRLKVVRLVEALFKQDRVEDGVRLLEENKTVENNEEVPFVMKSAAFQALNILAEKGDLANLEKSFELLTKNNYVEVTNVILGPLVKIHVLKNDMTAAINKLEELVDKFKMTPWKSELTKKLIEAEDAVALQRVTDVSTKVHGEVNSLYDLVFGFVECGRIRQARKILETPGMRSRQQRLSAVCERYQQEGSVAALEGLVEATKDMNHIDRSDIFERLLEVHIKNGTSEKALGLWTQMQDEDVQPSDAFLIKLANFLETKEVAVPFVKPAVAKPKIEERTNATSFKEKAPERKARTASGSPQIISFRNAIKSNDLAQANAIRKEAGSNISANDLSLLVEGLSQSNQLGEAVDLALSVTEKGQRIALKHYRFLTNKLANAGEVEKLKKIGITIDNEMKKLLSYDNKMCAAYLNSGRAAEFVEQLMVEIDAASPADITQLEEKFPRGTVSGVIEKHPELLPKFEQIAEKYMTLGSRGPGNALWIAHFLQPELAARADQVWEKFSLNEEPRLMFQRIIKQARFTNDLSLVDRLLARVQGSHASEGGRGVIHSCALDLLVNNDKLEEALARLQTVVKDVSLEHINTSTLQRLKQAVESQGKTFPWTIPVKRKVPGAEFPPDPLMQKFSPFVTVEAKDEATDFFISLIGFDGSCLRKPDETDWKRFLKDDTGILTKVPFNPRCIIKNVSIDDEPTETQKGKSSSSSSSDDEAEEKGERK